jgi:AraC-like DNA-binding protein
MMNNWHSILLRQCSRLLGGEDIDIRLRTLWHDIDANLHRKWTLDQMAGLAQLSEEHLRRLCINQYGLSPMRMLTKMRMQRASVLLRATNMKIERIANIVGYSNPLAFSTAFRKQTTQSPMAFRHSQMS